MSQHDMNIANQGFPAFRSDLNDALAALASTSTGATEPTTTFAQQLWYDSTANLLKMRNTDNDAWITLAYFDQTNDEWEVRSAVIQAVDSAGVVIKDDAGTTVLTVSDGGGVDVNGTLSADAVSVTSSAELLGSFTSTDLSARISVADNSDTGYFNVSSGHVSIGQNTGFNDNNINIDDAGNIGIGTNDTSGFYSTANFARIGDTGVIYSRNDALQVVVGNNIKIGGSGSPISQATYHENGIANLFTCYSDNSFRFLTTGSGTAGGSITWDENLRITPNGLSFDGGSNYLDDYEEGTFTATFADESSGGNTSTTASIAEYVKVGDMVNLVIHMSGIDTTGLTSGNPIFIQGMPFNSKQANWGSARLSGISFSGFVTAQIQGDYIRLRENISGSSNFMTISDVTDDDGQIYLTVTYRIS